MNPKFCSPLLIASQVAIFLPGSAAFAATSTWIGTDNTANNFNTGANWNTGGNPTVPTNNDIVIINAGGTANSTVAVNRAANTTLDGSLSLSHNTHLNIGNGGNPTFTVGTTGSLSLAPLAAGNSQYFIGSSSGQSTFTQNGGTVNVTVNRGIQISDGAGATRTGTFNLNGGTFSATVAATGALTPDAIPEIYGGFLAGRAGGTTPDSFNVAGGTATISAPNSPTRRVTATNGASVNVSAGSLAFNGFAEHRLGYDDANIAGTSGTPANAAVSKATVSGTGSLTFAMGGTNPYFDIGATPGYNGAIEISGTGAMTISGGGLSIGSGGANGNVTVTSGALTVNQFINIGRKDSNTAGGTSVHLNLNGGTLSTSSIRSGGGTPSATNNNIVANGGTIKALADEPDFLRIGVNGATNLNTVRPYVKVEGGGLTFDTNGFNVGIQTGLHAGDTSGGGLTKSGSGTLTLSGASDYTGATNVNSGTLQVTTGGSIAGSLNVAGGTTLAATGSTSNAFTVPNLNLANGSLVTIGNFDPLNTATPAIQATSSLAPTGTVLVTFPSTIATGEFPLIGYPTGGSIGGDGIDAFQFASSPRGVVADIIDSNGAVTLLVSAINPLRWKGNTNSTWDINTTTNWLLGATPEKYIDGDVVLFDDNANGGPNLNVTLDVAVTPKSVTFHNDTKNYTLSGTGSIGGNGPIFKSNPGTVTLLTAITSTGTTTVDMGTLQIGNGTQNGSLTGPLINNDQVVFNPAGTATFGGALDGFSNATFTKAGTGTQIITSATNTFSGSVQVNQGTLQFGNGTTNGVAGGATYHVGAGATLRFDQATAAALPGGIRGAGNIALNSAQAATGLADWGALNLDVDFTGELRVEKGRVGTNTGKTALGTASKIQILPGAQFLAFGSPDAYTTPIEIAGNGWGEPGANGGYPGGLRLAGGATATWAGSITLTDNSGIMAQRGTNFTVSGPITGAFQCEFYSGDPVAENGNLIVNPTVPGQNTYASTKINGRPAGSVVAGSDQAFSTGPLVVDNAILKLNGHSHSFASLAGAGGAIGNYHATTPATLTVGSGTDTSYAGILRDGAAAPLALTKTGTGTLTLTTALAYTGTTTVEQGKLALATASIADTAQVVINNGAVLELNTAVSDIVGSLVINGTTVPVGTYNSSHATYGSYFSGTGSLVVGGAFEAWASAKGLNGTPGKENGLTDDPDKDGMENLTEFYLDGNPLASDSSILPTLSLDQDYITLTFHRRDDAEASMTTQVAQYGANLTAWANATITAATSTDPNGVIVTVVENDAAADLITVKVPRTFNVSGKLFGRLQLTK